jgi:hypothetical protein
LKPAPAKAVVDPKPEPVE